MTTLNELGLEEASSGLLKMLSQGEWLIPEDWVTRALGRRIWPDSSWTGTEPALHRLRLGLGRRKGICPSSGAAPCSKTREVKWGWQCH